MVKLLAYCRLTDYTWLLSILCSITMWKTWAIILTQEVVILRALHLIHLLEATLASFTRKKIVGKTIGSYCFLIVGAGKKEKSYYLWSFFLIEEVEKENDLFQTYGAGFNFSSPILLNDLTGFADFKNYCGNFGLGFQNSTKHKFCDDLLRFANKANP